MPSLCLPLRLLTSLPQCLPALAHRYDLPLRQQSWLLRFFWRSVFDTDNIDIGPERRHYLDHQLRCVLIGGGGRGIEHPSPPPTTH